VLTWVARGRPDDSLLVPFIVGGELAWPWLVGIITLGVLFTVTKEP
jgi:hypothetical protein